MAPVDPLPTDEQVASSTPMSNALELRMLVKLESRSRDYTDKAMLAAADQLDRLQELLTFPTLTPEAPSEQFAKVLREHEKGRPVNGQDLINALSWRVRNQRREIARLQRENREESKDSPSFSPNFDERNGIK